MANIKTAISLPEGLFEEAEAVANEMEVSRSKLVAIALAEYIKRYQNKQLLEKINVTYADFPNEEEQAIQKSMRRQHRRIVEDK
ncbi:hypothetical protein [Calothrix sp. PCC 7507]|uniref:hypothetical protein n=1 Tax=Calothrix sp. PCC 7507 TaxID=99598 RepID=UPI00029F23F0|nr:hypothetical protein [Calothrix sp. PCC 7507]AFY35765.1 hypothetical protein Cal7507_5430 [Calothrix sp. PCC 7507]